MCDINTSGLFCFVVVKSRIFVSLVKRRPVVDLRVRLRVDAGFSLQSCIKTNWRGGVGGALFCKKTRQRKRRYVGFGSVEVCGDDVQAWLI